MAVPLEAEGGAEHKALRKQIKQLKKAASSGELDAAGAAELKALKKKAKALKGGEGAPAGEEQQEQEQEEQQQQEEQQAGGKKEKKKKRKDGAAAAAPAAAPEEQQQEAPPAKKKQKKAAAAAAAVDSSGGMAEVGDRQLAATRPALVKALYSQHADVAATSAAVVEAWRKERQTKVEGSDLNPITAFSQSSEWPEWHCCCWCRAAT